MESATDAPQGLWRGLRSRFHTLLGGQAGSLTADNMVATLIASLAVLGAASGSIMFSTAAMAHQQGALQRQAASNEVSSAVAQYPATQLTSTKQVTTADGVRVKLWPTTVDGQTIYNGQAVDCTGPGCRVFSSPLQNIGPVAAGAIETEIRPTRSDDVLKFTLPAGHDRFFYAIEGVEGDDWMSWSGVEQVSSGVPNYYEMSSDQECLAEGCAPVNGQAVFGAVSLGSKTTNPVDFTIHLYDQEEGLYTIEASDQVLIYTLPEA